MDQLEITANNRTAFGKKNRAKMAEPGPGTPLDRFSVSNYGDCVEYQLLRPPNRKVRKK